MSTINIEQFEKIVEFNIDNNIKRAILGLGPSGIGKSAVIKQITQKKNMGLIDLRLLLYTETDLKGIPFPNKEENRTCWLPNDILPDENRDGKRGILLIEELTSAPKRVQAAAYQLIQDRKLGTIVGTNSYGKGTVQSVYPNLDDEGIKVTIAKYHTPNERVIDGTGMQPDVVLELPKGIAPSSDMSDIQIQKAIELLK